MQKFTLEEKKERRMFRLAQIIFDHWEEGAGDPTQPGMDTRFFQIPLIHDSMVKKGLSVKGGGHREHVVPRVFIRNECLKMFENGATIDDVKEKLMTYLWIVEITKEEAAHLDHVVKHKETMPAGWVFGEDDPFVRLKEADIKFA